MNSLDLVPGGHLARTCLIQSQNDAANSPALCPQVLAAPNVLPALFGMPFQSIVWPLAIANLAGYQNKQFLFAAVNQVRAHARVAH